MRGLAILALDFCRKAGFIMGMTMSQKILAAHAGEKSVEAGQLIMAKVDMVLGNDITSPVAINEFNKAGFSEVFDRDKISLVMDLSLIHIYIHSLPK